MKSIFSILLFSLIASYGKSQVTLIPDPNFEQALIDLGYDWGPIDGFVVTDSINTINYLKVSGKGINNLTGIEDFVALDSLNCKDNNLDSLDMSQNQELLLLQCGWNNLSFLNISSNPLLKNLGCESNQLSSVDLSQNTQLEVVNFFMNNLTDLNVSNSFMLSYLTCGSNNLTTLDLSQNPFLQDLICSGNNLSELDVSNCPNLYTLYCFNNELSCLNLKNGNNGLLVLISAYNNPALWCVEVDDPVVSESSWTQITGFNFDTWVNFSSYCENSCSTGLQEISLNNKEVVKVIDLMGRETEPIPNTTLIYVYSDGTTEKVYSVK